MDKIIIKRVQIEGLWNKYNIDFLLEQDVNILVGNNGVGKTTILNIILSILAGKPAGDISYTSARIEFSKDYTAVVETENDKKVLVWKCNDKQVGAEEVPLRSMAFSSFDKPFYTDTIREKIRAMHDDISSELDMTLYNTIDAYYRYKSNLGTIIRDMIAHGTMEDLNTVYAQADMAKKICDSLFSDKTWYEDKEGRLLFKTNEDGAILRPSQLSSGEKQLLLLILKTLVAQSTIALWDEPEISLHVAWQQKLISTMRELNPNMQLIIATHSPSILYDGWEQRAINVNRIKTKA